MAAGCTSVRLVAGALGLAMSVNPQGMGTPDGLFNGAE